MNYFLQLKHELKRKKIIFFFCGDLRALPSLWAGHFQTIGHNFLAGTQLA